MEFECISDKKLESISGGVSYISGCDIGGIKFSQKEFDELKEANIIGEDDNLYYRDIERALKYLREKGYQENVTHFAVGIAADAWHREREKCWRENKPVKFEVI